MKNWPKVLKLFEQFVPINAKMDVYFKHSDKIILEHILEAYRDYLRGDTKHFSQWCCVLVNAIPSGVEKSEGYDTVLNITKGIML